MKFPRLFNYKEPVLARPVEQPKQRYEVLVFVESPEEVAEFSRWERKWADKITNLEESGGSCYVDIYDFDTTDEAIADLHLSFIDRKPKLSTPTLRLAPQGLFLVSRHHIAEDEVKDIASNTLQLLEAVMPHLELGITGPPVYFYFNYDPKAEKNHVEIGFPVVRLGENHKRIPPRYFLRQAEPLNCLSADFTGSVFQLKAAWEELVNVASAANYSIASERREIFTHLVSYHSPDNIIELQLGISDATFYGADRECVSRM